MQQMKGHDRTTRPKKKKKRRRRGNRQSTLKKKTNFRVMIVRMIQNLEIK